MCCIRRGSPWLQPSPSRSTSRPHTGCTTRTKPDEWNREVYGKCNNPHGHGHNYVLEVSVEGEPNAEIGYLVDMKDLKEIIRQVIVNDVDHRHLNIEVPWLAGIIPTSENLARVFLRPHRAQTAREYPPRRGDGARNRQKLRDVSQEL